MQIQLYKLKYGHKYNKQNARLVCVKSNKTQL